jgi:hypothetical protein
VLDMIAVKNEQLVICEEPSIEGAETKVDCITCDELATRSNGGFYCKRTRFVFLVAMDYLFFAFLVFNGATLWGTSVRIARSQGADTTPRALLLDIAHFFINLMFPHRNPQCEYCRGRLAREALRWHMHYCTEHYESCVHCGGLVNACRLAHPARVWRHPANPVQNGGLLFFLFFFFFFFFFFWLTFFFPFLFPHSAAPPLCPASLRRTCRGGAWRPASSAITAGAGSRAAS